MNERKTTINNFRSKTITLEYDEALKYDADTFFAKSGTDNTCPLCQKDDSNMVHSVYGFDILECSCEFMYLFPRPTNEELKEFYKSGKSNMLWHQILEETSDNRKKNFRKTMIPLIHNHLGPEFNGNVVDVGCGEGLWLDVLTKVFPKSQLFGIEPFASDELIRNYNIIGDFLEDVRCSERFDVCSFMSIIEHVRNPVEFLKKSSDILADDGIIFLTAPNLSGFDALSLDPSKRLWEVPQHINFFNLTSIKLCAEKAGFDVLEDGTFGFLDVDIVHKRAGDLNNDFLFRLLTHNSCNLARNNFQKFLTENSLSGQLYIIAKKRI